MSGFNHVDWKIWKLNMLNPKMKNLPPSCFASTHTRLTKYCRLRLLSNLRTNTPAARKRLQRCFLQRPNAWDLMRGRQLATLRMRIKNPWCVVDHKTPRVLHFRAVHKDSQKVAKTHGWILLTVAVYTLQSAKTYKATKHQSPKIITLSTRSSWTMVTTWTVSDTSQFLFAKHHIHPRKA